MIRFKHKGSFSHTKAFFSKAQKATIIQTLEKYGQEGVKALSQATPLDSGETANSWGFEIVPSKSGISIYWTNSNIQDGVSIAVLLQYGHGTRNGGYVTGKDYINPALLPVFELIAQHAWKEVTSV